MLSRLFPLEVKVSFEDRGYGLGETINLTVELSPRRDMEVREGHVDLLCEEHWTGVDKQLRLLSNRARRDYWTLIVPNIPSAWCGMHISW